MLSISATDNWRAMHEGAIIGLLELSSVENTQKAVELNKLKREAEARLTERYRGYNRQDFLSLPLIAAYRRYYKRFNKTYHVQLQVESIVLKGKNLPDVSSLVDANFITEVETLVLTAGHDAAKLQGSILIDVSREGDQFTQMNGTSKAIRPGDMIMRDEYGISCSVIYGQDNRSPISSITSQVLYVSYAPQGVPADAVEDHMQRLENTIRLFSKKTVVEQRRLVQA